MAINKKLITFAKKDIFLGANGINNATSANASGYWGNIPSHSIVFIKDTCEIWHNGQYFSGIDPYISGLQSTSQGFLYRSSSGTYTVKSVSLWGNTFDGSSNITGKLLFNNNSSLGTTWNGIKQFNTSGNAVSFSAAPAFISIQEAAHAASTDWVPWIAGGDITSKSSWGIGLGGDNLYIGRIAYSESTNKLSQFWKFDSSGNFELTGDFKKGSYTYTLPSKTGTVALTSDIMHSAADVIEISPVHTYIGQSWPTVVGEKANGVYWGSFLLNSDNGYLHSNFGSYLIKIEHPTDADGGIYTGVFSYTTGSGTDEEIILHRSGNTSTVRLFAKIKYISGTGTCLLLASTTEEANCTELTIKLMKLI